MDINNIFEQLNFKVKPDDDYRKSYLFRIAKSFYKIYGKEREYIFDNCKISPLDIILDARAIELRISICATSIIIWKEVAKSQSHDEMPALLPH